MLKIDLHTHTIASGHAFNTIYEMAKAASEKGVEILGITDHGPAILGSASEVYFHCLDRVPKELFGVKILVGAEVNVLDKNGAIDLPDDCLKKLDFGMLGLHKIEVYKDAGEEKNSDAIIAAMQNPYISIVTHIYLEHQPVNVERVAQAACDNGKLLNIGTVNFERGIIKDDVMERIIKMVKVVKKNGLKILLGSDAHVISELAVDNVFRENMDHLGLTNDDIVNNDIGYLRKFIRNI